MSKWQFQENEAFIERTREQWVADEDVSKYEDGWQTHIIYDGEPCDIIWFPELMRLKINRSGSNELTEKKQKEIALFGLTLIKLMRSGDCCIKEI